MEVFRRSRAVGVRGVDLGFRFVFVGGVRDCYVNIERVAVGLFVSYVFCSSSRVRYLLIIFYFFR